MNVKRFFSGALCAVLLLALCPVASADAPVEISSAEELSLLRETPDGDFVLTADIDMTGIDWAPAAQTRSAPHLERIGGTTGAAHLISGVRSRSSRGVKRWSDVGEKNGV